MLKKYVSKFAMDILPSVAATIIGAYIVNHYIVTRPADPPVAAATSTTDPKKADVRNDARTAGTSAVANIPEPGVKAKGISEKAMFEKSAAEQPATAERPADKSVDKPAETASIPTETRRHQPAAPREKAIAKTVPAQPAPAVVPVTTAPVVAAPNTAPAVEAAAPPEDHRDANDLARAAIERLRGAGDGSPRAQEAARIPDAPRMASAPVASTPPIRPLPPPIMVSTPRAETFDGSGGSSPTRPPYAGSARIDDPGRPTPPADIPEAAAAPPLDLRAEAVVPQRREHTTVAEDVLSAAKSVFHAVLPK
jgi:hypothetical protein